MSIRQISLLFLLLLCSPLINAGSIPAGTQVLVRTGSTISSGTAHAGETWIGFVDRKVVVHGQTVAHSGDVVTGKITQAKASGRLRAPGQLVLRLTSVTRQPVSSSAYIRKGNAHGQSRQGQTGSLANDANGTSMEAVIPTGTPMTFTITK